MNSSTTNLISTVTIYENSQSMSTCSAVSIVVDDYSFTASRLLKWEDGLRSHPAYIKAALEASRVRNVDFMQHIPFANLTLDLCSCV